MRKFCLFIILLLLTSCMDFENMLNFRPNIDGLKLSELTKASSESYIANGSMYLHKEPVLTEYDIGEMRLVALKLKNVTNDVRFISEQKNVRTSSGQILNGMELDLLYSDDINKFKGNITQIDFNSDVLLQKILVNDSIKNYYVKADEFKIKLNDNDDLTIVGYSEYKAISDIYFDILFYKVKSEMFIFIMNSGDKSKPIKKGQLYNYLFKNILPE